MAQLSFIRKINGEFGVNEESASVNRLCGRARGENISKEVEKTLTQYNPNGNLLRCVTSDGGVNVWSRKPA